jgi:hypothetical protein
MLRAAAPLSMATPDQEIKTTCWLKFLGLSQWCYLVQVVKSTFSRKKKIKTKKQQKKLSDMLGCKEKQTPKVWEYHQTSKQNRAWRLA